MRRLTRYAKVTALGLLLALGSCVGATGCGAAAPPQLADARRVVDAGTVALSAQAAGLEGLRAFTVAACIEPPIMPRAQCDAAQAFYADVVRFYEPVRAALDVADQVLTAVEGSP